jgi:hypothetical protein
VTASFNFRPRVFIVAGFLLVREKTIVKTFTLFFNLFACLRVSFITGNEIPVTPVMNTVLFSLEGRLIRFNIIVKGKRVILRPAEYLF